MSSPPHSVCLIALKGNNDFESHSKAFKVSDHLQEAHISELMDFIAISIRDFITSEHISSKIVEHPSGSETLELGFTFSFPVTQTAIDAGMLLRWTKGFSCPGAVGNDIVQLLQEALNRNEVNVHVGKTVNKLTKRPLGLYLLDASVQFVSVVVIFFFYLFLFFFRSRHQRIFSHSTKKEKTDLPPPFSTPPQTNLDISPYSFLYKIAALVNDTVGTLLAHSYKHPNTFIGAIFGTGTNGAYVEDTRGIKTMTTPTTEEMIINIEWGNYDKDKRFLPVTIFDNKLDRESIVSARSWTRVNISYYSYSGPVLWITLD